MIRRIVAFLIALSAMGAAAGVLVVSAAYALFALVRDYVGPSGAAAIDCAAAAILIAALGFVAYLQVKPAKASPKSVRKTSDSKLPLSERLAEVVRDRPMVAAGAATAAGLLAWRNPVLVSTLLRLLDVRADGKRQKP